MSALPENFLSLKVTRALAYYDTNLIIVVKCCTVKAPERLLKLL
jgi:hypothetical protein